MKVYKLTEECYGFKCPGCGRSHNIPTSGNYAWSFNNNLKSPTFTPSILNYYPGENGTKNRVCHSFVTDGKIQFLSDCFHSLAGQTIDLPEID